MNKRYKPYFFRLTILVLLIFLIFSIFFSVTIGQASISLAQVIDVFLIKTFPSLFQNNVPDNFQEIIWNIRFPRILLALLVGASLSVIGVILQALTRNALADPYILGISSGASVGAVAVILLGFFSFFGVFSISIAAFLSGLVAFIVVLMVASQNGKITPLRIILAGVAVSYACSAITSYMVIEAKDAEAIQTVQFWLLGSLSGARWVFLPIVSLVVTISSIVLFSQARTLNAILLGEETAITLGVNIEKLRKQLIGISALNIGSVVAVSGAISFVGLVIPHIVRILVGANHTKVLPMSALVGAIFLIWADLVARTIAKPEELPIGIITSFIGAPFFMWLMRRKGQNL